MIRIYLMLTATLAATVTRLGSRRRDERGAAVEWLIVLTAGIGIAYFAGDSVWSFAKQLAGGLGGK